jgi:hypothetical protein
MTDHGCDEAARSSRCRARRENRQAKKQVAAARAEADNLRQKLGETTPVYAPRVAELPTGPYAMATTATPLPPSAPS